MKIKEIIKAFSDIGSEEPEREAYLTVEHLFNVNYASALAEPLREYDNGELDRVLSERRNKIPLQYIFGEWYFMGERFLVSRDCLIPRQDTEILVENAVNVIKKGGRIADLCTGSGCIGISVLINRQDITDLTLVDISEGALRMARKNAELHGLSERCTFILEDVTKVLPDGKFDAILSNPPYIPSRDMDTLSDEVKNEPKIALDGGAEGLDIIKTLVYNCSALLNSGGCLMIEFGYDQKESMTRLLDGALKEGLYSRYEFRYDYGGNIRMCYVVK